MISIPRARSTASTFAAFASRRPIRFRPPADRAGDRVVLRLGALACSHLVRDPLQGRSRPRRQRAFDEGEVDLLRLPSRERFALRGLRVPAAPKEVDVEPGRTQPGLRRHQHPHFRKSPRLVDPELSLSHVRGVVHLQHHVRQRVVVHVDDRPGYPRTARVQVQRLVGLDEQLLVAGTVEPGEVRRAEALDPRPA